MASLDGLSDGEIRVKLTELGYPAGPITVTTRKVLLKKLKYLLDQAKSPGSVKKDSKNSSSLSRYSSEEDSEDDVAASRQSMPPPPPKSPQKPVKRKSTRRSQEIESNNFIDHTVSTEFNFPSASSTLNLDTTSGLQNHRYSPKNIQPTNHILSKGNSTDRNSLGFGGYISTFQSKYTQRTSTEPYDTGSDNDGIDEFEGKISPARPTSTVYSSFVPRLNTGLSPSRSRFQPQLYGGSESSRFSPNLPHVDSTRTSSSQPFSSDFVRRLSAASPNKSGLPSRLLDVKESDDEDGNSTPTYNHQNTGSYRKGASVSLKEKIWLPSLPMVVLFLVTVFFCGLAVVYMSFSFKEAAISSTDANFPICKSVGAKPGVTCILDSEVQPTMIMFREMYEILNNRAVQYACESDIETSALSQDQIIQQLVNKLQTNVWSIESQFGNIKVLIGANPQWGVEVRGDKLNIPSPVLPLGCYLLSIFYGVIGSALRIVVVAGAFLLIGRALYWWIDRKERNQKEVFKMVENIIDILSTHQQSSGSDNYLAISHVRDQLIPPYQRDKMANIWAKSVSYLEENESRVRTEVQQVSGEEFRVWRWLPAPRSNGKRKVWQGQAFETMEGSVNSLPVSPTPCLKIRHMFDSDVEDGEDWMIRVQDAILEKCDGVNVLHVAVDKNSNEGCVYVKCASPQDAGHAYRALHGSWFDSKLVTVKYLRLERYHERFPEAAHCIRPLRPSNDSKLSLQ